MLPFFKKQKKNKKKLKKKNKTKKGQRVGRRAFQGGVKSPRMLYDERGFHRSQERERGSTFSWDFR